MQIPATNKTLAIPPVQQGCNFPEPDGNTIIWWQFMVTVAMLSVKHTVLKWNTISCEKSDLPFA